MNYSTHIENPLAHVRVFSQGDGTWGLNNSILITGNRRRLLIDTHLTRDRTELLLQAVAAVSPELPIVAALTHAHGDHTNGTSTLSADTLVVGSIGCYQAMIGAPFASRGMFPKARIDDLHLQPPDLRFEGTIDIDLGHVIVQAIDYGPGHSTSDTVYWLPESSLAVCGDIHFEGGTPYVATGSITEAIRQVQTLQRLNPEILVPGHGPVTSTSALGTTYEYLTWVLDLAETGRLRGHTPWEVATRYRTNEFSGLFNPERLVGNLHRAYLDLDGNPPGEGADISAVVSEMSRYAGRSRLSDLC